jgi:hypothetical protein
MPFFRFGALRARSATAVVVRGVNRFRHHLDVPRSLTLGLQRLMEDAAMVPLRKILLRFMQNGEPAPAAAMTRGIGSILALLHGHFLILKSGQSSPHHVKREQVALRINRRDVRFNKDVGVLFPLR